MATDSEAFTAQDIQGFVTDYLEQEKAHLIDRMKGIIDQVNGLAPQLTGSGAPAQGWRAEEILAHMATAAQYFGWIASRVVKGEDTGEILEMLRMRDTATEQAASQPAQQLASQLAQNLTRTIALVEKTDPMDLRKTFDYVGIPLSAEDLIRIPLCSHLETHIDQIREGLA